MIVKSHLLSCTAVLEESLRFCMEAGKRPTEELVGLASAAASAGTKIDFTGLETRSIAELIRIVAAGGRWQGRIDRHATG